MDKNRRNYGGSLVNIFSVERSSQESRGFSHERFNRAMIFRVLIVCLLQTIIAAIEENGQNLNTSKSQ